MPGILFFIKAMSPDFPELRPQRFKEPLRPVRAPAELATESPGDMAAHRPGGTPRQFLPSTQHTPAMRKGLRAQYRQSLTLVVYEGDSR